MGTTMRAALVICAAWLTVSVAGERKNKPPWKEGGWAQNHGGEAMDGELGNGPVNSRPHPHGRPPGQRGRGGPPGLQGRGGSPGQGEGKPEEGSQQGGTPGQGGPQQGGKPDQGGPQQGGNPGQGGPLGGKPGQGGPQQGGNPGQGGPQQGGKPGQGGPQGGKPGQGGPQQGGNPGQGGPQQGGKPGQGGPQPGGKPGQGGPGQHGGKPGQGGPQQGGKPGQGGPGQQGGKPGQGGPQQGGKPGQGGPQQGGKPDQGHSGKPGQGGHAATPPTSPPTSPSPASPAPLAPAPPPMSRCRGYVSAWTEEESQWCCTNMQLGCSSPHLQCTYSEPSELQGWEAHRLQYCCQKGLIGCDLVPKPFDCDETLEPWNTTMRTWCCKNKQQHCPSVNMTEVHECRQAEQEGVLSRSCCSRFYIGCAAEHDCFTKHPLDWAPEKREWCCREKDVGCRVRCSAAAAARGDLTDEDRKYCCDVKGVACTRAEQITLHANDGVATTGSALRTMRLLLRGISDDVVNQPCLVVRRLRKKLYNVSPALNSGTVRVYVKRIGVLRNGKPPSKHDMASWSVTIPASWNTNDSSTTTSREATTLAKPLGFISAGSDALFADITLYANTHKDAAAGFAQMEQFAPVETTKSPESSKSASSIPWVVAATVAGLCVGVGIAAFIARVSKAVLARRSSRGNIFTDDDDSAHSFVELCE